MAFALTSRISDTGSTTGQNKTTASFTPTANSLLVVVAAAQRDTHTTVQSWTISDTASLTWTSRATSTNITGNYGGGIQVWTAQVGASPSSMTVTVDPWSGSVTGWIGLEIFDITGHDTSSTFPQTATTNTTTSTGNAVSLTVTLGSAPTNGNLVMGLFTGQNDVSGAFAAITGFTELSAPAGGYDHIGVWYRSDTTSTGITQSDLGQSVNWGAGVAMEVKSASSGTNASATVASATGTANSATTKISPSAGSASATGAAQTASVTASAVGDTFTRADASTLGADWTNTGSSTIGISGNQFYFGDSFGAGELQRHRYNTALSSSDMAVQVDITTLPPSGYGDARVMARWSGTSFYELRVDQSSGNWTLARVVGATETDVATGTVTLSLPETWALEVTGTNPVALVVKRGGSTVGTYSDTDATRIQTGTRAGIGGYTAGGSPSDVKADNWAAQVTTAGTSASATVASATGTANSATTKVSPSAGSAAATGTAQTPSVKVNPSAGSASATGTANDATVTRTGNGDATVASATGTAHNASVSIAPNAGVASGTGTANNPTVTTNDKWENYTDDFPGSALGAMWNTPYGDTPTVSGNKLTFPTTTTTYSGTGSASTHSLIGSYVLVYLNPRTTGGFIGISVKASDNTDILLASYRHTAGQLQGDYNGSDFTDTDSQGTVTFSGTDVWLRVREASGTGYMEYSTDGTTWNTIHSDTLSSSALTALATAKIELNQGPFSSSITSTGSFAKFNLPPTGTSAAATVASGTGTANNATVQVAPTSGSAAATGTANNATTAVSPSAGVASATGTAHDATVTTGTGASATVASATGTAHNATVSIQVNAGSATATGTANNASANTGPLVLTLVSGKAVRSLAAVDAIRSRVTKPAIRSLELEDAYVNS